MIEDYSHNFSAKPFADTSDRHLLRLLPALHLMTEQFIRAVHTMCDRGIGLLLPVGRESAFQTEGA
jgi:hypothetical protein